LADPLVRITNALPAYRKARPNGK